MTSRGWPSHISEQASARGESVKGKREDASKFMIMFRMGKNLAGESEVGLLESRPHLERDGVTILGKKKVKAADSGQFPQKGPSPKMAQIREPYPPLD